MELFEALKTRRSIRKFTDEPVSDDELKTVLEAAMMAPSAGNAQPWQFIVVTEQEKLEKIGSINPYAAMAARAPVSILVCGDLSLEKFPGYWVQDCSAAVENMLLAIHGLGLGAVWTGVHPLKERIKGFRDLLGLPEQIQPLAFLVIGHPDQQLKSESRYREDRIHHNQWEG